MTESLGTSPGLFHVGGGGLVFQLICRFCRYWTYSSKSTVRPKMESCFQDGACSVCFLLQHMFSSSFLLERWQVQSTKPGFQLLGTYCVPDTALNVFLDMLHLILTTISEKSFYDPYLHTRT